MQIFLVLDNYRAHQTGGFIDVALDGDASNHIAELNLAAFIGKNRDVVWIPLHKSLAFFHRGAVVLGNHGADDHVVPLKFAFLRIVHADRAVLVQHDPTAVERLDSSQVVEADCAIVFRFDDRLLKGLTGRAADVEGSHGQLRSRLANGLRGDNADCFAHFHELASREVASVTHRANAAATLARKHRTNLQALHADAVQFGGDLLVDVLIHLYDLFLLIHRVGDGFATDPADDALPKVNHFFIALINRAHNDSIHCSAVFHIDDHILRRVHQLAGEITGVRGLKRGVSQTFASAVSRNKVLKHAKTFTEVGSDGVLEDFAAWLGHQTAHASELTHLLPVSARPGIDHQINRIQFLASLVVLQGTEHDIGNLISGVRPDVDDLVVTFPVGDDAFAILLFNLADLLVCIFQLRLFLFRNNHVRNSNRDAGLGCFGETELL